MSDRESRSCDVCGQEDDHPRHIIHAAATHPVTGEPLDLSIVRHIDCCRDAGCPDGSCHVVLDHAGSKRGSALIKHLEAKGDEIRGLMNEKLAAEGVEV